MMKKISKIFASVSLAAMAAVTGGCSEDSPVTNPPVDKTPVVIDRTALAKGADVSWITQLEAEGEKFYASDGTAMECMELLRDNCGINAIRLRVWVDPEQGWNSIDDVLVKARRAHALGLRLMIDFHFSDTWADPGHQATPAAWADLDIDGLNSAVTSHVNEMLRRLQDYGIEPEWVQIGNETRSGMLYPLGNASDHPGNFSRLVTTGYDAVKAVFPEAKVIVHLDGGDVLGYYTWLFGILRDNNAKYDMIGMSLYPEPDSWQTSVNSMISNIATLNGTFSKPVIISEIGMDYREAETCNRMLSDILSRIGALDVDGIFYWEPEAPAGYNDGYNKGCFENGTPTVALDAFK